MNKSVFNNGLYQIWQTSIGRYTITSNLQEDEVIYTNLKSLHEALDLVDRLQKVGEGVPLSKLFDILRPQIPSLGEGKEAPRKSLTELQQEKRDMEKEFSKHKEKEEWYKKGCKFIKSSNYDEAINCFDRTIEIDLKHREAWHQKGICLAMLGQHENAIKCFESAIEIYIDFKEAWYNKGLSFDSLGNSQEAIKCFERAIAIDPKYKEAWFRKGVGLTKLGQDEEAIRYYERATKIDSKFKQAKQALSEAIQRIEKK